MNILAPGWLDIDYMIISNDLDNIPLSSLANKW